MKLPNKHFLQYIPISKQAMHDCISMYNKFNLWKFLLCFKTVWTTILSKIIRKLHGARSSTFPPSPFPWISVIQLQRYKWTLLRTLLMASTTLYSLACFLSETVTHFLTTPADFFLSWTYSRLILKSSMYFCSVFIYPIS